MNCGKVGMHVGEANAVLLHMGQLPFDRIRIHRPTLIQQRRGGRPEARDADLRDTRCPMLRALRSLRQNVQPLLRPDQTALPAMATLPSVPQQHSSPN